MRSTPRQSSAASASSATCASSRARGARATWCSGSPGLSLAGSAYQGLAGPPAGRPAPLDLAAEAALVRFLWKASPLLTLAHDCDRGGLAVALAEAALWSGVGAELELPDDELALFAEGGGQAVVACAPEDVPRLGSRGLVRLGVVGGDSICGVPLEELRRVREGAA